MSRISGIFDAVPYSTPQFSQFDGRHDIKTACSIGKVFPLSTLPVYGSDTFNISFDKDVKFSPLVAPMFQKMLLKEWSFYVRNSDLWDNYDQFYTGVDPRSGRTAYDMNQTTPAHPYFKYDNFLSFGDEYLGVKLNLSVTPEQLSQISYNADTGQFSIPYTLVKDVFTNLKKAGKDSFSFVYGSNYINSLMCPCVQDSETATSYPSNIVLDSSDENDVWTIRFRKNEDNITDETLTFKSYSEIFGLSKIRKVKPFFSPGSVSDYLGYTSLDFKSFYNSGKLTDALKKSADTILELGRQDPTKLTADNLVFISLYSFFFSQDGIVQLLDKIDVNDDDIMRSLYFPVGYFPTLHSSINGDIYSLYVNLANSIPDGFESFVEVVIRQLIYMKFNDITNSTDISEFPCMCILPLNKCFQASNVEVESLRFRGYWKIWNDYFRDPNLTAEFPIPYASNGDDWVNITTAIENYVNNNNKHDWCGESVFSESWFPDLEVHDASVYTDLNSFVLTDSFEPDFRVRQWILHKLTDCFRHVRQRDYITGALPDSSVVEVVAPIMSTEDLDARKDAIGHNAITNAYKDSDGNPLPDNELLPTLTNETSALGWLDIENLEITRVLKRYFTQLRHTMQGIRDYMKVFFDVSIDDLTLHRAEFLGGNESLVNVSQITQQSETDVAPLGQLGGRASLYVNGGSFKKYVKENGFIITLNCLSPIITNVGGIDRQLIRKTRFDYFNPMFAKLGDQAIKRYEVNGQALTLGADTSQYEETFGYTPRYMELKFLPNRVHADFLGSMSDWHLDLMQPTATDKLPVLSQRFLEEETDDRIFAELNDDENNCFIWCNANVVYSRALPMIQREVIA